MKQLVIMPGGFHPFHAGHAALYQSAVEAFPGADVYVAATNDTSTRPFPFPVKEKLAQLAGVKPNRFVQVKSPFRAEEITHKYDPNNTQLIFVRSEKDAGSPPKPGGIKKDGNPSYLQPYNNDSVQPLSQQAYMAYLPTVEFGPGMTSATEIRNSWPKLNEKRKQALVMSLYPKTQTNPKLAATVVKLLDTAMGTELNEFAPGSGDGGDEKSYLLQLADDLGNALYGPNKNKQEIESIMGKIRAAGGDVKISWNNDSTMNVVMYHPVHFKQGYLIRLVGRGDQGVTEGPIVSRIVHPRKISIYLRPGAGKPPLLVATDIPYEILDRYIAKVISKYPQFKATDFSFKPSDKVSENQGWAATYEALKPDAFNALQQAKQRIEQDRQQEIDQWEQDFRTNTASRFAPRPRPTAPAPAPVAQPGEKHAVLKARIAQLDLAIKKQQQLDALSQKLEYKGLLTPAMQQDLDTRMYVRDAAADNYQALNQKLDRAIEIATNRLTTNKLAFREDADYIDEAKNQ